MFRDYYTVKEIDDKLDERYWSGSPVERPFFFADQAAWNYFLDDKVFIPRIPINVTDSQKYRQGYFVMLFGRDTQSVSDLKSVNFYLSYFLFYGNEELGIDPLEGNEKFEMLKNWHLNQNCAWSQIPLKDRDEVLNDARSKCQWVKKTKSPHQEVKDFYIAYVIKNNEAPSSKLIKGATGASSYVISQAIEQLTELED